MLLGFHLVGLILKCVYYRSAAFSNTPAEKLSYHSRPRPPNWCYQTDKSWLKYFYNRYLHMWAWLIMDYVVKEVNNQCQLSIFKTLQHQTKSNPILVLSIYWYIHNIDSISLSVNNWLLAGQVHEDGSGHWECSLISHMFLCGNLKERNLTLCYVPGPIFRIFKFFFGEKTWGIWI